MGLEDILRRDDVPEDVKEEIRRNLTEKKQEDEKSKLTQIVLEAFLNIVSIKKAEVKTLSDYILYSIGKIAKSDFGFYGFLNEDESMMTIHSWSGEAMKGCSMTDKPSLFSINEAGIWAEAIRQRKPVIFNDYSDTHPAKKGIPIGHVPLTKLLVVPIFSQERIISVAAVANREADYNELDIKNLNAFLENMHVILEHKKMERMLVESEEHQRMIIENTNSGYFYIDFEGCFRRVNRAWLQMHKYESVNEVIGQHFSITQVDSYKTSANEKVTQLLNGQNIITGEFPRKCKDGSVGYHIFSATAVEKAGKIVGIEGFLIDITDYKKAEIALKESEIKHKKMISNISDVIGIMGINGIIKYKSPNISKFFGWEPEDLIGTDGWATVHPDDLERIQKEFFDLLQNDNASQTVEYRYKCKDGSYKLIELTAANLSNDLTINGVLLNYHDITERRLTENKLQENHNLLTNLARLIPSVIYQYRLYPDGSSAFPYASPGMNDIYEVTPEEVREDATPVFGRLHPEDFDHVSNSIQESARTLNTFFCEYRVVLPRQGLRWRWSQAQPERMADGGTLWYGIISDITERKQLEEELRESNRRLENLILELKETQKQILQQEKLRSLGQMTSGICHDINNSLTPIMGYIDLLQDDEEIMEKHTEELDKIIKSTKRIARTIGRLREFYKVKVSNDELFETDINNIIERTIELTTHRWKDIAESTGAVIEIKKEFQKDLPLTKVDENEITEALTNLILNACDAMQNEGILTFSTNFIEDNIIIEIKDNGIGMDAETLEHCIDPFFTTKGNQGTGLGLSMVFGVVDRHNGKIEILSEKNKGTAVKLILPLTKEKPEKKINDDTIKFINPLNILSVEDDDTVSGMLKKMLSRRGHSVEIRSNGKLAFELYKQELETRNPFDLVITDLGMAEMDGNTLSKLIKDLTPEVPIILLTGWGILINKEDYPTIDFLLKKPFTSSELFRAINELFSGK